MSGAHAASCPPGRNYPSLVFLIDLRVKRHLPAPDTALFAGSRKVPSAFAPIVCRKQVANTRGEASGVRFAKKSCDFSIDEL